MSEYDPELFAQDGDALNDLGYIAHDDDDEEDEYADFYEDFDDD